MSDIRGLNKFTLRGFEQTMQRVASVLLDLSHQAENVGQIIDRNNETNNRRFKTLENGIRQLDILRGSWSSGWEAEVDTFDTVTYDVRQTGASFVNNQLTLPVLSSNSRIIGPDGNPIVTVRRLKTAGPHVTDGQSLKYAFDRSLDSFWYESAVSIDKIQHTPTWAYHVNRSSKPTLWGTTCLIEIDFETTVLWNEIKIKPFTYAAYQIVEIISQDEYFQNTSLMNKVDAVSVVDETTIRIQDIYELNGSDVEEMRSKRLLLTFNQPNYVPGIRDETWLEQKLPDLVALLGSTNEVDDFRSPIANCVENDPARIAIFSKIVSEVFQEVVATGKKDPETVAAVTERVIERFISTVPQATNYNYEYIYGAHNIDVRYTIYNTRGVLVSNPLDLGDVQSVKIGLGGTVDSHSSVDTYLSFNGKEVAVEQDQQYFLRDLTVVDQPIQTPTATSDYVIDIKSEKIIETDIPVENGIIELKHPPHFSVWKANRIINRNGRDFNPNDGDIEFVAGQLFKQGTPYPINLDLKISTFDGVIPQDKYRQEYYRPNRQFNYGSWDGTVDPVSGTSYDDDDDLSTTYGDTVISPLARGVNDYTFVLKHTNIIPSSVYIFFDTWEGDSPSAGLSSKQSKVYYPPVDPDTLTKNYEIDVEQGLLVLEPSFVEEHHIGWDSFVESDGEPLTTYVWAVYVFESLDTPYGGSLGGRKIPYTRNVTQYLSSIQQPISRPTPDYPVYEYIQRGRKIYLAPGINGTATVTYRTLFRDFRYKLVLGSDRESSSPILDSVRVYYR